MCGVRRNYPGESQTWKWFISHSTSSCNLERMVSAQQGTGHGGNGWRSGADLFPPVSSMKGAISSARLWFQTAPALQSTAVFGEHQRCSRATAWIRLAYTTIKELLGLQGFSLGYINLSILHLFSNKGFKDLPLFCAAYYFKVCTNHQQSIIFKTPKDPGMSIIQETKDNSYRINRINGSIWMCKAAEKINTQKMKV